jgi:hypothetical protein
VSEADAFNHDNMVILCELYDVQTLNDPMSISLKLNSILAAYRAFHSIKVHKEATGVPLYGPDILGPYVDANLQLIQDITAQPQLYDLSKISLDPINITSYCRTYSFSKLSIPKILPSS